MIRLIGIDTPAMPATCRATEACPPGDPFAARDALRALSLGRPLACEAAGTDGEGRTLARCRVEDIDLSCAMLASGHAVLSKTAGDCNCTAIRRRPVLLQSARYTPLAVPAGPREMMDISDLSTANPLPSSAARLPLHQTPWSLPVAGAMVMIGLWMAMANLALLQLAHERWPSRHRWGAPMGKLGPWLFLGLAAAGASPAAWTALWTRHAGRQQDQLLPRLLNITGIQIGLAIGALWWWIAG